MCKCKLSSCSNVVEQPATGRRRLFCSRKCAVADASLSRSVVGSVVCRCNHCDKAFASKRSHSQWCSEKCRKANGRQGAFPAELMKCNRWVRWCYVYRDGQKTKLPLSLSGKAASSTDKNTWTNCKEAMSSDVGCGVGFVLSDDDDIYCIDLDNCFEEPSEEAKKLLLAAQGTYSEISPSGKGVHLFFLGKCNKATVRHDIGVEVYSSKRFLCMTGKQFSKTNKIAKLDFDELSERYL